MSWSGYVPSRSSVSIPARALAAVMLTVAMVSAGCGAAAPAAVSSGSTPPTSIDSATTAPSPSVAPSPASPTPTPEPTPTVVSDIPAAAYRAVAPISLSSDGSAMWVMAGSQLERIDPATGAVASFDIGAPGQDLGPFAMTSSAIWVPDFTADALIEVDRQTLKAVGRIPVDSAVEALAVGDVVWVAEHHQGAVMRIDAVTGHVVDTLSVSSPGDSGPSTMVLGDGSVWVIANHDHAVIRVDSTSGKVTATIPFPTGEDACGGMAVTRRAVWVACGSSSLVRIDPAKERVVAAIALGQGDPSSPTIVGGKVWVAVGGPAGVLERIDPATDRVDRKVSVGSLTDAADARVAFDSLWVAGGDGLVLRFPLSALRSS